MRCPFCGSDNSRVVDSRPADEGTAIRRRRECLQCKKRFTTYEKLETAPLMVVKKDGRREEFSREKLLAGLRKACEKRPIPVGRLEELAAEVERGFAGSLSREIESQFIGEAVIEKLRRLDPVAYVRFASVYREFRDVESFLQELKGIIDKGRGQ